MHSLCDVPYWFYNSSFPVKNLSKSDGEKVSFFPPSLSFVFALQSRKTADSPAAMCWGENEDYFECVHGFKEKKHRLQVVAEKKRREGLGTTFDINSDSAKDDFYSKAITAGKIRQKKSAEDE